MLGRNHEDFMDRLRHLRAISCPGTIFRMTETGVKEEWIRIQGEAWQEDLSDAELCRSNASMASKEYVFRDLKRSLARISIQITRSMEWMEILAVWWGQPPHKVISCNLLVVQLGEVMSCTFACRFSSGGTSTPHVTGATVDMWTIHVMIVNGHFEVDPMEDCNQEHEGWPYGLSDSMGWLNEKSTVCLTYGRQPGDACGHKVGPYLGI